MVHRCRGRKGGSLNRGFHVGRSFARLRPRREALRKTGRRGNCDGPWERPRRQVLDLPASLKGIPWEPGAPGNPYWYHASRSCQGGQDPAGTCRQSFKERGCQEGAVQGFTEGREEGRREATAQSRRASAFYSGAERVALPSRRAAPLWRNAVVTASG